MNTIDTWEYLYDNFLKNWRNTKGMTKKTVYVRRIAAEFSNKIPLDMVTNIKKREQLSIKLFGKTNHSNYVLYSLCMACYLKAISRKGEFLMFDQPDLLE